MDPVGVPFAPDTATVTPRLCPVLMLLAAGVTVTVGFVAGSVTEIAAVPEALVYVDELAESGVYAAVSVSAPAASDPAAIVIVADPEVSVVDEDV